MASSEAQDELNELMRSKERRNAHPEDDNEDRTRAEHEQSPISSITPQPSMTGARDVVPRTKYGANTGPKGVISDAQSFRDSKRLHRESLQVTRATLAAPGSSFGQQLQAEKLKDSQEHGDLEDELDDDDDEFMIRWRKQRLQALQGGITSSASPQREPRRNGYGNIATVDGEGYLETLENAGHSTVVLVYICDDSSEVSQLFEQCLRMLANRHQTTKFIKLDYIEAQIEVAGVPGIIAYRAGSKFAALIPLIDEMPDDGELDASTLEKVLQKHQIL